MKILIFGATGKAGRVVAAEALARGHQVVAFVHKNAPPEHPQLTVVRGDAHNTRSIAQAAEGCDAVISCLSSWGTPHKDVLASAMRAVIPALEANNVHRIVTLTGNIAKAPGETLSWFNRAVHGFLVTVAPKVAHDAEDHMALLAASNLNWTTVRSPVMVNGASNTYRLTSTVSIFGTITRQAIAACMLDLVTSDDWSKQAPLVRRP